MMRNFLEKIAPFLVFCFGLHDFVSDFLAKQLFLIKRLLLIAAYASLVGILFLEFRKSFGFLAQLMLFLTSNNRSQRFLGGRRWKMLHRIAYVLPLTVLLYVVFIQGMKGGYDSIDFIKPVSIVFAYVLLKIFARKNFIASLRDMIAYMSNRYQTYTLAKKANNVSPIPL